MERKYDKDNPMPRTEFNRVRRSTQRRISTRKKNQIKPAAIRQFEQVLFDAIKSKTKNLPDHKHLQNEIKARVKEFVFAENDEALRSAAKLKDLFAACGLGKRELLKAVKQTKWAKLHDEILELEIKKGVDEIEAGYYITLETKEDFEKFFEGIIRRGLKKLKAKQKIKNYPVRL